MTTQPKCAKCGHRITLHNDGRCDSFDRHEFCKCPVNHAALDQAVLDAAERVEAEVYVGMSPVSLDALIASVQARREARA
jgi:hypothetical protein